MAPKFVVISVLDNMKSFRWGNENENGKLTVVEFAGVRFSRKVQNEVSDNAAVDVGQPKNELVSVRAMDCRGVYFICFDIFLIAA